jgi:hypothetical protein
MMMRVMVMVMGGFALALDASLFIIRRTTFRLQLVLEQR